MREPPRRVTAGRRWGVLPARRNRRLQTDQPGFFKQLWRCCVYFFGCGAALILGVSLGMGVRLGWQRLVNEPRLAIKTLEVLGAVRTSRADVLAYANVHQGEPLLALDIDAIADRVRQHPWVLRATVRRQLPDRLVIEVAEHVPSLFVALGEVYVADEEGQLFKSFAPQDGLNLPVLTGLDREAAAKRLDAVTSRIRDVLGLAHAIQNYRTQMGVLEELHWDADVGWSVVVRKTQKLATLGYSTRIHLGREPLQRLSLALATLRVLAQKQQTPAIIWADGVKNLNRVQVQLAGTPGASVGAYTGGGSHGTEG